MCHENWNGTQKLFFQVINYNWFHSLLNGWYPPLLLDHRYPLLAEKIVRFQGDEFAAGLATVWGPNRVTGGWEGPMEIVSLEMQRYDFPLKIAYVPPEN